MCVCVLIRKTYSDSIFYNNNEHLSLTVCVPTILSSLPTISFTGTVALRLTLVLNILVL